MGCCKTKMDVNSGITYNEEDELPQFEAQTKDEEGSKMKFRGGVQNNDNTADSDFAKSYGAINDNPKFNQELDNNRVNAHLGANNDENFNEVHNGMKPFGEEVYPYNLFLTIKESKYNKVGQILKITPKGYEESSRKANDGIVYFGLHSLDFKNDFCFKAEEGVNKQHFEIKYEKENHLGYYVKNLNGSGVFIKIDEYLNLKDGVIISFGSNHLLVLITQSTDGDQKDNFSNIRFKVIYGPNKGEEQ